MSIKSRFQGAARRLGLALALTAVPLAGAYAKDVTVFAAASLKDVMGEIAGSWKTETGKTVKLSFAASSALAKQIEQGAPADLYLSADLKWMDYLEKQGLIDSASRRNLLGNAIVLIAPKDADTSIRIGKDFPLAEALGDEHLAMGNTDAVPAGIYGKQALTSLGVWNSVKGKIAQADNVRAALLLVSRGEAPLGIVYSTDAKADPGVKVVDSFPEDSHTPIIYPAARLKAGDNEDATAFLEYLSSPKAVEAFKAAGFTALGAGH
ncbi:molybdate ABC transporter substrate-binding protein [Rhizobium halophytocola]|uniref:Molybdate transport system substrate-binding protein n=1 Tax=Rhizobium halophytocola TaxID=735519 RepID=A0ABS4DXF5_9HYPH|nr:molybdate ABC transporter substrate-binding protein [Rhizobium halophytocola]MBP1850374.1 molybdate transport system substrate-binding protein [Rhizobium halophytocola]